MKRNFYTESELMSMPLKVLRSLDIDNKDQENLVQKVVNRRLVNLPPSQPIFRKDVPDIQNPEQEAEWQDIINQRTAKLRPSMEEPAPVPTDAPSVAEDEGVLDPESADFNPEKLDLATKTGEGKAVIMGKIGSTVMEDGMSATPGKPITLRGGVPAQLTQKPTEISARTGKPKRAWHRRK